MARPMSIREIVNKAQDFDFNPHIPLRYWLRTADTLLREAQIYEAEENDQQAYLLYMRYATLVTEKLSQHPAAREPEGRRALRFARGTVPLVIDRLELLKPAIDARYESYQIALSKRKSNPSREGVPVRRSFEESDPAIAGKATTLAAADNGDLAVRLAHKEIRRRDAARKATRQAGFSEEEEQGRRAAGLWDDWESNLSKDKNDVGDEDVRQQIEATRRTLDRAHDMPSPQAQKLQQPRIPERTSSSYRYPSITKSQPLAYQELQLRSQTEPAKSALPTRPAKEAVYETDSHSSIPVRPSKQPLEPRSERPVSGSPPPYEEDPAYTFKPSAYLENGSPLRTVFLPPTLRDQFLEIAYPNTRRNLETCGILCGTLISNALFISRLVIPEQESTSDTCEMLNESALFDFCDSEDLMVLGWIHTHPTQTCFLSSRDLHTHCGYQVMMAESIAIVCAPSKTPSWGVFRLTDPPGMKTVLNCTEKGIFHPHAQQDIYTDASRPGHVFEAKGLEFEVVDLRSSH